MNQQMFVIYDSKLEVYNAPFLCLNEGHAIRQVEKWSKQNQDFHEHPEDFTIFKIGIYEDTTADITKLTAPIKVIGLWELLPKEDPRQLKLDMGEPITPKLKNGADKTLRS